MLEITDRDIQMLTNNPKFAHFPPAVLLKLARKLKEDSFARNYWAQQAQAQQQAQRANGGLIRAPSPNQSKTAQSNNPVPPTPTTKNVQQVNPSPGPAQAAKNSLKRSSTDDLTETQPPQNAEASDQAAQDQKARMEAMRDRQAQLQITPEEVARLQAIAKEELVRAQQLQTRNPDQDMTIPPAELMELQMKLRDAGARMSNLAKALGRWFHLSKNEDLARLFFRKRLQLARQFNDGDKMTTPRDSPSMSIVEVNQIITMTENMKHDLAAVLGGKLLSRAPNQNQPPQPAPGGPAPLNAANLERQAQILKGAQNAQNNRSGGKGAQPPPPPTTAQPPFPFGAKKSPAGGPTYLNKPSVTAENLHLPPPRKKTKTGAQQTSSPATQQATAPSPQAKPPSPEMKRQAPVEPVKPETKTFACPEPDCESHQTPGFYSEEALQAHHQEEHVRPNEDPFNFVNEHMTFALGLDLQGHSKTMASQEPLGAPPMSLSVSKQGQTPMSKPDFAATPMSRDASMRRQGSSAGVKMENAGTPGRNGLQIKSENANTPKLADGKLPGARQESEAPQMSVAEDPWANSTIDPQNLFATFAPLEALPGSLASDMAMYRSLTPNDTPESSKDSGASEPNSDISEGVNLDIDLTWQSMDGEVLMHMTNFNMEGFESGDADMMMAEDNFTISSFDDMTNDYSKPFQFDNSLYSMDPS